MAATPRSIRSPILIWLILTITLLLWKDLDSHRVLMEFGQHSRDPFTTMTILRDATKVLTGDSYLAMEPPLRLETNYQPASSETYVVQHAEELGFTAENRADLTRASCGIFQNQTLPIFENLQEYRRELAHYTQRVDSFTNNITDLRIPLQRGADRNELCSQLDLQLEQIFAKSQQLSYGSFGYAEPLIPPLRHPEFCFDRSYLMKMTYMVHDWSVMCRRLTPFSRTVFIDMGASLEFHAKQGIAPAVYILEMYKKFGFKFDHIYAFEIKQQQPQTVFDKVPAELLPNYHWMNVGVESDPNGKMNPLRMLLEQYGEDDFVVIKLDIDTSTYRKRFRTNTYAHHYDAAFAGTSRELIASIPLLPQARSNCRWRISC